MAALVARVVERVTRVIWLGAMPLQAVDGGGDAGGEVGVGGGGLVPGDDAAGGGVEGDGVGVGAAGVDAEDEGHGVMVARIGRLCMSGGVGGAGGLRARKSFFQKTLEVRAGCFLAGSGVRRGPKPGHRRSAAFGAGWRTAWARWG